MGNCFASEITGILRASRAGSEQALDKLALETYRELQPAARPWLRNHRASTLQTTRILIDMARSRRSHNRGSGNFTVSLDEARTFRPIPVRRWWR